MRLGEVNDRAEPFMWICRRRLPIWSLRTH